MTNTPNKGYNNQSTGTNYGTWGIVLNQNFTTIDNNLGGTLSLSVAGNSNVTLTASQAQNLIYNLSGALTGNINVIFPQQGGFYFVNNQTSGAFTLTLEATGCTGSITLPQGTQTVVYVDAVGLVLGVLGSTQYTFSAGTVGGSANALTISQTFPGNFSRNNGTLLTFTPSQANTASATLTTPDGNTGTLQKVGAVGLVNLASGDLQGFPVIAQWNGSVWVCLNVLFAAVEVTINSNQAISYANLWQSLVCTSALSLTITQTTNLATNWFIDINALGGAVTITINAADKLNGGSLGVGLTMPQGSSGRLVTDAAGNLYLNGTAVYTAIPTALPNGTTATTQSVGDTSTKVATNQFVSQNAFGSINIQKFSTAGTFTYTPTSGLIYAIVEIMGAGGAGATVSNQNGGAGGAGGYLRGVVSATAIGASKSITVGAAGTPGNTGGTTSFGTIFSASGGASASANAGGAGGSTFTGGQLTISGQPGGNGFSGNSITGGYGGGGVFGPGAGGVPQNNNGITATNPGSGGSGGNSSGSAVGGNGAPGIVVITEYI